MSAVAQCPAHKDYDPFDLSAPHADWQHLRENSPVYFHEPTGYYIVSRYDDVKAVFNDWETFSSDNAQAPMRPMCAEGKRIMKEGGFTAYSGLSARMPPDHTRIRKVLQRCFGPRRFKSIEPKIKQIITRAFDTIAPNGKADFYREIAYDVPALVLFTLMGIPDEDVPKVKEWAASRAVLTWGNLSDEEQLPHAHNMVEYWAYCRHLVASRKISPGDDLPSDMVRLQREGAEITDDEIAGVMYSVLFAGHETTTTLMANAVVTLMQNRDQWDAVVADPSLIPKLTDEMLRFSPSIVSWRRRATKATEVGGVAIPENANVLMLMGSGNRDESVFPQGEHFIPDRKNARTHLSFGYGIHYCVGFQLAKMEFGIMLRQLSSRFPDLRLQKDQHISYLNNVSFRVPSCVNVEWGEQTA
ncbi:MAG: cytochrome P450 [Thiolinea sp.]